MIVLLSASLCAVYHSRLLGTNLFSLRKLHSSRRKRCLEINFTVGRETLFYISKGCSETQAQIFLTVSTVKSQMCCCSNQETLSSKENEPLLFWGYIPVSEDISFFSSTQTRFILSQSKGTIYRKSTSFKTMGLVLMLHERLKNIEQQNSSVI